MVLDGVTPIILVVVLGFFSAKLQMFSLNSAKELNRMVFFFALPMFCINLITNADFEKFNFILLACYVFSQAVTGTIGSLVAHRFWKLPLKTSVLIGLATTLSNHVLFVLPIAQNLFAGYIIDQISAIIIVDTILIALIVISVLEGLTSQSMSLFGILARLSKNPPVLAVFAGLLMVALAIELPVYLTKLVTFSAYAAAPTALFSMGIVIYNTPILAQLKFAVAISSIKVILQPLVFMIIAGGLLHQSAEMLKPGLMVAVGPSGTMVLVFASAYNIDPKPLAPVVVLSFLISIPLLCLTLLL